MKTRITGNYSEAQNKEALFDEIEARRKEGKEIPDITATSLRTDMEAALELNDGPQQPPAPLPPLVRSGIPQVPPASELPQVPGDVPKDEEYGGSFTGADGEEYALAVKDDALNGRTHFAKNSVHFWNGTAEEFKAQFTKK